MGAIVTMKGRAKMAGDAGATRAVTLVWIDAREAILVSRRGDATRLERVESEVPAHRRATGHVRHDPTVRHGGGGSPQDAGEPHRLEHLERFVAQIAGRLPSDEDLLILGPGTVREHLERHLRESDDRHRRSRIISGEASARRTDRQLVARLKHVSGIDPRRRTVPNARLAGPARSG